MNLIPNQLILRYIQAIVLAKSQIFDMICETQSSVLC